MAALLQRLKRVTEKYPVLRGMITYSVLWPTSNVVQQSLDKTRDNYDPVESLRYLILGTFGTAPTVYVWVKIAGKLVKGQLFKHAVLKAGLEQILFAPVGISQFYFGITLLEGRPWSECVQEWKEKFIPTWRVGMCVWPVIQTVNFAYVAEKNRVVVVSIASFMWTIFLSYMHHLDQETLPAFLRKLKEVKSTKEAEMQDSIDCEVKDHR
ncbi:PXMP2/4 family protein 4-like [Macrobrachium nipponense]|uniref:PXMP2/4 family protein 4-like n=1 Tax=Macrobrachium nipponense TaxID=159736 RepID=UPI0030C80021